MFSYVRRIELCLDFYFTFLFDCYIDIIKFANILFKKWWNLCHQNFILFSLVSHIVLMTMKWQMFEHFWLPINKHKLYSYKSIET